jgi:hypothetical protein
VDQPLGFRQIGFATLEFLSKDLVLGHINGAAYDSFQSPVFYNRGTDATDMSEFAVNSTTFRTIRLRLNQRPRKTLGFETPANKLQAGVASTG